jgi:hypothetical protein
MDRIRNQIPELDPFSNGSTNNRGRRGGNRANPITQKASTTQIVSMLT